MQVPVLISPSALLEWARRVRLTLNPIAQGYPFQQLDADPTDVGEGFTYFNTVSKTTRQFNGTVWNTL
jgi:hypothetical protein